MMKNENLNKSIDIINMPKPITNLMKDNNIILVEDLCKKTKTDLKKMSLSFYEINQIDVKLQLMGLCLKGTI